MRIVVTADGPLYPLMDYFADEQAKSMGWQSTAARSLGLLIDWIHCRGAYYARLETRQRLLADFAQAVRRGTIGADGADASGLYWRATSAKRSNEIVSAACACSDWFVEEFDAISLDPGRPTTYGERIAYWRRMDSRSAGQLLRHTGPSQRAKDGAERTRRVSRFRQPKQQAGVTAAKKFPENRIFDLLFQGFARRGTNERTPFHLRYSIRDILIVILLHGAGRRTSEPFHLYTTDVWEDPDRPGSALVRIYHPEEGAIEWVDPVTKRTISGTREKFLREVYNRLPRNLVLGERSSGWKNPALSDAQAGKFIQIYWFPKIWGQLFWSLYKIYIRHLYPARRLNHPFLFISFETKNYGNPYTLHSFRANHASAVRKIGLAVKKSLGTTPHGHRHAMGARMDLAQVAGKVQTLVLAHTNPMSRLVYNERSLKQAQEELRGIEQRLVDENRLELLGSNAQLNEDIFNFLEARDPTLQLDR